MPKPFKITIAVATLLLAALLAQAPNSASAAPTSSAFVAAAAPATILANWVPWDGFHITTLQNCLARRAFIASTYGIPYNALRCTQMWEGLPPCGPYYYILEVDLDQAVAPRDVRPADLRNTERALRPTCLTSSVLSPGG